MTNTLNKMFIFTLGAAAGSLATWLFLKTRYERLIEEDIASVKEYYSRREEEVVEFEGEPDRNPEDELEKDQAKKDIEDLTIIVEGNNYVKYGNAGDAEKEVKTVMKPYVIPPKKFGDCDYETITLTYYQGDDVLADDADEPILDVEDVVGIDSFDHFGENEDDPDVVYVRNDAMKVDYEICRNADSYAEVVGESLYRAEGK